MQIQIKGGFAKIDRRDLDLVINRTWNIDSSTGYASANIRGKHIKMHRLIARAQPHEDVDHKNHDTLDNRRSNLRICDASRNGWNSVKKNKKGTKATTSKYKGVTYSQKQAPHWTVELTKHRKKIFRKAFWTERDAGIAYNIIAQREFGEFFLGNKIRALKRSEIDRITKEVDSYCPRGKSKGGCITYRSSWGKWVFTKVIAGKRKYIGAYETKAEAESARDSHNGINNLL